MEAAQDHALGQSRLSVQDAADAFAKRRESAGSPRAEASVEDLPTRQRAPALDPGEQIDPVEGHADDKSPDAVSDQEDAADGEETSGPIALSDEQVVRLPDGTELPVTELRRGLLREADYTQKTQALSERRKVMDEAAQVLSFHLGTLRQQTTAELQQFQGVNWPDLYDKDPVEYQRKRLRYDQAKEKLAGIQRGEQEFLRHVEKMQEVEARQRQQEAIGYLTKHYPGSWSQGEYQALLTYAAGQGWPQAAVESWDDPKVFLMLRKARAFDEAQKVGTKKVVRQSAGQTLKSTRGAAPRPATETQRKSDLQNIRNAPTRMSQLTQAAQLLANQRKSARPR